MIQCMQAGITPRYYISTPNNIARTMSRRQAVKDAYSLLSSDFKKRNVTRMRWVCEKVGSSLDAKDAVITDVNRLGKRAPNREKLCLLKDRLVTSFYSFENGKLLKDIPQYSFDLGSLTWRQHIHVQTHSEQNIGFWMWLLYSPAWPYDSIVCYWN